MFEVTLSFDNGPDAEGTPYLLDLLARRGIRASFFLIGRKLALLRPLAERAHAEGHWIGNHSWHHSEPFGVRDDPVYLDEEIDRAQAQIGELGHARRFYRPFGSGGGGHVEGALSPASIARLRAGGFSCVLWNAIPGDWKDADGWVETALAQVASQPHSLVVLHDTAHKAMRHIDRFLDEVEARGGRFGQDFPADCVPIDRGRITGSFGAALHPPIPAPGSLQ